MKRVSGAYSTKTKGIEVDRTDSPYRKRDIKKPKRKRGKR